MRLAHSTFWSRSLLAAAVASTVAFAPVVAGAQGAQVNNPAGTQELGVDAGATFGLGDESSIQFDLPATRARIGFFQAANSRWSLEPAVGLSYIKVEGADGVLSYNVEGGALYHFQPGGDLVARGATVSYVRPFVGITGYTGDDADSEVSAGAGFGIKIPWRGQLAWRLEANAGYGFDNEAFRLGAFAGISFFTRNAVQ